MGFPDVKKIYSPLIKDGILDTSKDGWENSLMAVWFKHYNSSKKDFVFWKKLFGKYPEWEDLQLDKLETFRDEYIKLNPENRVLIVLSNIRYCVRKNLEWYTENILEPNGFTINDFYSCTKLQDDEICDIVSLDEGELYKLHNMRFASSDLEFAKKIFMIGCLTGAKSEDAVMLSKNNLDAKTNSLIYVPKRLEEVIIIPVHPYLRRYLNQRFDKKFSTISYSKNIKRMCEIAGINQMVPTIKNGQKAEDFKSRLITPDSARASFANNIYKRGGDIYEISRMLGVSINFTTKRFIVNRRGMDRMTYSFFKKKD